jgi:hypothetical protein
LTPSFSLLFHKNFKQQCDRVIGQYPQANKDLINKQIITALEKIISDPFFQKCLEDLINRRLQCIIRRIYVGGRGGHRLIYISPPNKPYILPVFISEETRANFDYSKIPWEEIANNIYEDFKNKNYGAFTNWRKTP